MPHEPDEKSLTERIGARYRGEPIESAEARERLAARLRDESPPNRGPWTPAWWIARMSYRARPLMLAGAAFGMLALGVWLGTLATSRARNPMPLANSRAPNPVAHAIAPIPTATGASASGMSRATFAVVAPGASRVTLVGDFNGWDAQATPLRRAALGDLWIADLPLPSGVHVYAFVVDGTQWIPDPSAPLAPMSSFGARTSVVVVGESSPL